MKRKTQEDAEVFVRLVQEHRNAVYGMAYARVQNVHDAEDITQEVFIEAYRNFRKLKNPQMIRPWLYRVTLNRSLDKFRKKTRRKKREHAYTESNPGNPSPDTLIAQEQRSAVMEAIEQLPEEHRIIVLLRYFARLSYADISQAMGLPKTTISNRLQSAKRKLREQLTDIIEGVK